MPGLPSLLAPGRSSLLDVISPQFRLPPSSSSGISSNIRPREDVCAAGRQASTVVMLARPRSVSFVSQQNCLTFFRLAPSFMTRTQGEAVAAEGLPAAAICSGIVEHVKKAAGASQHVRCLEYSSTVVQSTLYSRECICPCYMSIDSPMRPLTSCEGG